MAYEKHKHFPTNLYGNDFIIGDLHGCYDELMELLAYANFNPDSDRLFSVGDVIDRGPDSLKCAELIYEPWFYAVIGNHELMMVQSIIGNKSDYRMTWEQNGGLWNKTYTKEELLDVTYSWACCPMIISVGEGDQRFNIVHAELIKYDHYHQLVRIDDTHIDIWDFDAGNEDDMLWGRNIIETHWEYTPGATIHNIAKKQYHSSFLSPTYVGHSFHQSKDVVQIQQHVYMDTGCSMGVTLSMASPTQNLLFQRHSSTHFTTKNLSEINKINIPV